MRPPPFEHYIGLGQIPPGDRPRSQQDHSAYRGLHVISSLHIQFRMAPSRKGKGKAKPKAKPKPQVKRTASSSSSSSSDAAASEANKGKKARSVKKGC